MSLITNDAIMQHFGYPGAVNDKVRAFFNALYTGSGSPEGVTTANTGAFYLDTTNGALYAKQSGSGNTGWIAGVAPGSSSGPYAPIAQVAPGVRLYNPRGMRRATAALANARFGFCSMVLMGDSIGVGAGSDDNSSSAGSDATYRARGWWGQLKALLAVIYGDPGDCWIAGASADNGARWVGAGGTTASASISPLEAGMKAPNASGTLTMASGSLGSWRYAIPWTWNGGGNTASYSLDGAGAVTFNCGNNTGSGNAWTQQTTIDAATVGAHGLVFTGPPTGGGLFLAGVEFLTQLTGVRMHRMAKSGNTTNNLLGFDSGLNGNPGGQTRILASIGVVPHTDVLIIPLGVNDFGNQNSTSPTVAQPGCTPTVYGTNLQAVVNQAVAAGACVLLVGEPRQNAANYPSPMTYTEQNYYDVAKAIAQSTDHCAFVDINDLWGSNVLGQGLSLYTTASVHPSLRGHSSIAWLLYQVLTMRCGENALTT